MMYYPFLFLLKCQFPEDRDIGSLLLLYPQGIGQGLAHRGYPTNTE
jgi:hypothetical protein